MQITYTDFKPLRAATRASDALLNRRVFATVKRTVTKGWWRWRTVETQEIMVYRDLGMSYWRNLTNGEYVPGDQVEALASAFEARSQLENDRAAHPQA